MSNISRCLAFEMNSLKKAKAQLPIQHFLQSQFQYKPTKRQIGWFKLAKNNP